MKVLLTDLFSTLISGMHNIRTVEHANSAPTWEGLTIRTFADLTTYLT